MPQNVNVNVDVDVNKSRKCNGQGKQHDQIIHFVGGVKRLIQGVMYTWENEMVHLVDYLGVEYVINKNNVLFFERVSYEVNSIKGIKEKKEKKNETNACTCKNKYFDGFTTARKRKRA